ncbi:MAG: hypothetical protein SF069_11145 [Phycisphaerae bacterium]|nr:hypothetical protein [Phycisphaerae bacterium]
MTIRENLKRSMETLGAAWRQGAREIGGALYGPGTVAQSPEYGMPNTKLPSEVADGRRAMEADIQTEPRRSLADRVKEAEATREPEPPQREAELTRD